MTTVVKTTSSHSQGTVAGFGGSAAQRRGLFSSSNPYTDSWIRTDLVYGAASVLCFVVGAAIALLGGLASLPVTVTLLLGLVVLANYRIGVWIAILMLPFSFTALFPREMFGITGLNPLNAVIAGTIAALALAWILRPNDFALCRLPYLWWLYVLPISLAAFHGTFYCQEIPAFLFRGEGSVAMNNVTGYLQGVFVKPAIIVVVAIVTAIAVRNVGERFGWLMVPVFVAATLVALIIPIFAFMAGDSTLTISVIKSERFRLAVGAHANEIGLLLNTAFALSLFTWIGARRGVVKILLAGVIAIVSVSVALTFSRSGYLGWLTVVVYFLATRRKTAVLLGTVVVMLVIAVIMPPEIVERAFFGIAEHNIDQISSGRVYDIWLPLLPTLLESPLFGHGLSSMLWSEPLRRGTMMAVGQAHNAYLELVLDLGLVGAVLVLMFWFRLWQAFRALSRELSDPAWRGYFEGASVCILILLVQNVTGDRFTPTFPQSFIWVSAGFAFGFLDRFSFSSTQKVAQSD